jgi:hypothetical protein
MSNADIVEFHQYSEWLRKQAESSTDWLVTKSEEYLREFLAFDRELPDRYGWRFTSAEAFARQSERLGPVGPGAMNLHYWSDTCRNLEAYSVMVCWRGAELLRSGIRLLNLKDSLAAAIVCRSLVELSSAYLMNVNSIEGVIKQLPTDLRSTCVASQDLEENILKYIWGTRLPGQEEIYKQTNILTVLQKLTKSPQADQLLPRYERLCEVAHPNVIGNMRFLSDEAEILADGSEKRLLLRQPETETFHRIVDDSLWAIGWSAGCFRNGFAMLHDSIYSVTVRLAPMSDERGPSQPQA